MHVDIQYIHLWVAASKPTAFMFIETPLLFIVAGRIYRRHGYLEGGESASQWTVPFWSIWSGQLTDSQRMYHMGGIYLCISEAGSRPTSSFGWFSNDCLTGLDGYALRWLDRSSLSAYMLRHAENICASAQLAHRYMIGGLRGRLTNCSVRILRAVKFVQIRIDSVTLSSHMRARQYMRINTISILTYEKRAPKLVDLPTIYFGLLAECYKADT